MKQKEPLTQKDLLPHAENSKETKDYKRRHRDKHEDADRWYRQKEWYDKKQEK